jgi:hypothetical protein
MRGDMLAPCPIRAEEQLKTAVNGRKAEGAVDSGDDHGELTMATSANSAPCGDALSVC